VRRRVILEHCISQSSMNYEFNRMHQQTLRLIATVNRMHQATVAGAYLGRRRP
jgi:hypothetical protein